MNDITTGQLVQLVGDRLIALPDFHELPTRAVDGPALVDSLWRRYPIGGLTQFVPPACTDDVTTAQCDESPMVAGSIVDGAARIAQLCRLFGVTPYWANDEDPILFDSADLDLLDRPSVGPRAGVPVRDG